MSDVTSVNQPPAVHSRRSLPAGAKAPHLPPLEPDVFESVRGPNAKKVTTEQLRVSAAGRIGDTVAAVLGDYDLPERPNYIPQSVRYTPHQAAERIARLIRQG